jgi:uncharacterized protein (DUF1697 family)
MSASRSYVALLRGVNLGPRNRIAMTDLRRLVEELGAEDVTTYLQSGNVVFRSRTGAAQLGPRLEKSLGRALGLEVTVVVKTGAQLAKICERNPFSVGRTDPKTLHVTFLAEAPARSRVRELSGRRFAPDRFEVTGHEVYLHCPNGYGRSKLSNDLFERALDVRATTRNWRTVRALAELAS